MGIIVVSGKSGGSSCMHESSPCIHIGAVLDYLLITFT